MENDDDGILPENLRDGLILELDGRKFNIFKAQMGFLSELFSFKPKFFDNPNNSEHPAYKRWLLFQKIIRNGSQILYPEQKDELHLIGQSLHDTSKIVEATNGELSKFKIGSLNGYTDNVQVKIEAAIVDKRKYNDLMVELYMYATHKTMGNQVELFERDNYPDLRVDISRFDKPLFIECKRLYSGSINRINSEVKKANNQLSGAIDENNGLAYGVAIFDFSSYIEPFKADNTDDIPIKVNNEIIPAIEAALRGNKNRSVGAVVVIWDNYSILGEGTSFAQVTYLRHCKIIRHPQPNLPIPDDVSIYNGSTILMGIIFTPRHPTINYTSSNPSYNITFPNMNW